MERKQYERRKKGFSYLEVVMASCLLGIFFIPIGMFGKQLIVLQQVSIAHTEASRRLERMVLSMMETLDSRQMDTVNFTGEVENIQDFLLEKEAVIQEKKDCLEEAYYFKRYDYLVLLIPVDNTLYNVLKKATTFTLEGLCLVAAWSSSTLKKEEALKGINLKLTYEESGHSFFYRKDAWWNQEANTYLLVTILKDRQPFLGKVNQIEEIAIRFYHREVAK